MIATAPVWDDCDKPVSHRWLVNRDMFDVAVRREKNVLQSLSPYVFAGGVVHPRHDKGECYAITADAAIFRDFPMGIREAFEEMLHHGMNGVVAMIFAEVFGVISGIGSEQGRYGRQLVCIG